MQSGAVSGKKRRQWPYLLLLITVVATLWMPFYAFKDPMLGGAIPFFYWYLLLWVPLSAVINGVVYFLTK